MMQWMWSDAAALSNDLHPPPGFNIAVRSIAQARVIWRANACYVTEYTVCSGLFKSLDPVTLYSLPPLRRRDAVGSKQLCQIDAIEAIAAIAELAGDFRETVRLCRRHRVALKIGR